MFIAYRYFFGGERGWAGEGEEYCKAGQQVTQNEFALRAWVAWNLISLKPFVNSLQSYLYI